MLAFAWTIGVWAVMRSGMKDWRLIIASVCAMTALALFISWWIRPTELHSPQGNGASTQADPAISPAPVVDTDELAKKLAEMIQPKELHPVKRAHVHVTKFEWSIPTDEGGRASVKVYFVNDGSAPVLKMLQCSSMGYFLTTGDTEAQKEFERDFISKEPAITHEKLEANDNQIPVGVDRSFVTASSPWAKGAIDNFRQDGAVVYLVGSIFYSDGHSTYKSTYCGYTGKDGNMKFCGKHNEEP